MVQCFDLTTDDLGVLADFSGSLSASDCDGQSVVTVGEPKKVDLKAPTDCDHSGLLESAGGALGKTTVAGRVTGN